MAGKRKTGPRLPNGRFSSDQTRRSRAMDVCPSCGQPKMKRSRRCVACDTRDRHARTIRYCEHCGVSFQRHRCAHGNRPYRFCSKGCAGAARTAARIKRLAALAICECGNRKGPRARCCRSCMYRFRGRHRSPQPRAKLPIPSITPRGVCVECGASLPLGPRRRYCSDQCARRMYRRLRRYQTKTGIRLRPDSELFQMRRAYGTACFAVQQVQAADNRKNVRNC